MAAEIQPANPAHTNRLAREKSPYLLQHAHNPVDWFPLGDEAFEKVRRVDPKLWRRCANHKTRSLKRPPRSTSAFSRTRFNSSTAVLIRAKVGSAHRRNFRGRLRSIS